MSKKIINMPFGFLFTGLVFLCLCKFVLSVNGSCSLLRTPV
jgi:hypothetical protein